MARHAVAALLGVDKFSTLANASAGVWMDVVARMEAKFGEALREYRRGRAFDAVEMVVDAYFGIFEWPGANMEVAVRRFVSFGEALRLEKGFTNLRKTMDKGVPPAVVEAQARELVEMLKGVARILGKKGVRPEGLMPHKGCRKVDGMKILKKTWKLHNTITLTRSGYLSIAGNLWEAIGSPERVAIALDTGERYIEIWAAEDGLKVNHTRHSAWILSSRLRNIGRWQWKGEVVGDKVVGK